MNRLFTFPRKLSVGRFSERSCHKRLLTTSVRHAFCAALFLSGSLSLCSSMAQSPIVPAQIIPPMQLVQPTAQFQRRRTQQAAVHQVQTERRTDVRDYQQRLMQHLTGAAESTPSTMNGSPVQSETSTLHRQRNRPSQFKMSIRSDSILPADAMHLKQLSNSIPVPYVVENVTPQQLKRALLAERNMRSNLVPVPSSQIPPSYAQLRIAQLHRYFSNYPFFVGYEKYPINRRNTYYNAVAINSYPIWFRRTPNWVYSTGFTIVVSELDLIGSSLVGNLFTVCAQPGLSVLAGTYQLPGSMSPLQIDGSSLDYRDTMRMDRSAAIQVQ